MSDGKILHGQQFDPRSSIVARFTQQTKDYTGTSAARVTGAEGNAATEIVPVDEAAAKVTVFDTSAIQTQFLAQSISFGGTTDVTLPDVLTALTMVYNKTHGDGAALYPSSQQYAEVYHSGNASISPRASAQASAAVIPDLQPTIVQKSKRNVPCHTYVFYIADGSTNAQILTKAGTLAGAPVNAMPNFKPEALTFTLKGQSVSLRQDADSQAGFSFTDSAPGSLTSYTKQTQYGNGYSTEVGLTNHTKDIPPTLHAAITITLSGNTDVATVDVQADTLDIDYNGSTVVDAITNNPAARTHTVTASVEPLSVAATSPTSVPTTGLYANRIDSSPFDYDLVRVLVEVVDMSYFA